MQYFLLIRVDSCD